MMHRDLKRLSHKLTLRRGSLNIPTESLQLDRTTFTGMNGAPPDMWHPVPVTVLKVHSDKKTHNTHLIHLQHKVVLCKVWRVIVHVLNQNLDGLVDLEEFRNQLSLRSDTHHDKKKQTHKL